MIYTSLQNSSGDGQCYVAVEHGAKEITGKLIPAPFIDNEGPLYALDLFIKFQSKKTTITVISS